MIVFTMSQATPTVYVKAMNHELEVPWSTLDKVMIKEKLTNDFGLNPFCGQMDTVVWYAGYYYEDYSWNTNLRAERLVHWVGLDDASLVYVVNDVNQFKDQGKYGGITSDKPSKDPLIGIQYTKNQALYFTLSKSQFGKEFIISFWFKATMDASSYRIPIFTRKNADLQKIMQVFLLYTTSPHAGINILVQLKGTTGQTHGQFALAVGEFHRVTLVFLKHYN